MLLHNKKSSKKPIIIASIVGALLVTGGLVYAFREDLSLTESNDDTVNYDRPTEEEVEGEETAEQSQSDEEAATPSNTSAEDTTTAESAAEEVIISSINQDGNTLAIRTIIQPLVDGGTCMLGMSKVGQEPIQQTAQVQNMPSYSTCQGFNVDVSDMAKGSWNVEITYSHNGKTKVGNGTAVVR